MRTSTSPRSALNRGTDRARYLLRRIGDELRIGRLETGMSARQVGRLVGISHTQVRRIENGLASHVDLVVLARIAAVLGGELSIGFHPVTSPVRDAGHLALLGRLRSRLASWLRFLTEVPMPIQGHLRAADALIDGGTFKVLVEAETRLGDIQAVERRARLKARDLDIGRVLLLVADTRHDRAVIAATPGLADRFPIATRATLRALGAGVDPGGDCLVVL